MCRTCVAAAVEAVQSLLQRVHEGEAQLGVTGQLLPEGQDHLVQAAVAAGHLACAGACEKPQHVSAGRAVAHHGAILGGRHVAGMWQACGGCRASGV
jgi:hypothetical protein